jgi:competence protein ComEA
MVPAGGTTSETAGRLGSQSRGFLVSIVLSLGLAVCAILAAPRDDDGSAMGLAARLNPNTATISSLTRLPGVGLARASAIVAYRRRVQAETGLRVAFRQPEDLQRIRGIGPKTAQQMARWLDFQASSPDAAGAAAPAGSDPTPSQ